MVEEHFGKIEADKILRLIREKKSAYWSRVREETALRLFRAASARVPAYKDFLKKNKVNPAKIKTFADFERVPETSKANYLRQYPLEKLVWDGNMRARMVFAVTSGSTGVPTYFPRDEFLDNASSVMHEMFFRNNPSNLGKSTLVVVGFGMGEWVGGLITVRAFQKMADRGYPIALHTPGSNKKMILEGIKRIAGSFDQVVLCGYPPFLKDVIDEGESEGIRWKKLNLKIVFAAEAFSETFRDYIAKKAGIGNIYTDMMNIYGTADLGTTAEETPLSIFARRMAVRNGELYEDLFEHAHRLPTLAQFNPLFTNFEVTSKEEILCTGNSTVPLIRYAVGDHGGVKSFKEVVGLLAARGIRIKREAKELGFTHTLAELPFVYVYERSDLSTKLYGAIIYPEHVREGIAHPSVEGSVTGKFTMLTQNDKKHNEYLELHVELKPKVGPSQALHKRVYDLVVEKLLKHNAEYKYLFGLMPDRIKPKIVFWDHEHPRYFKPGGKQKWVEKG